MAGNVLRLRVRYGETDQMGVVYHANYLLYFEAGRTELLRAAGVVYADLEKQGLFLLVTATSCRYRAAARYDENIEIRTEISRVGKASIGFRYEVRGEDGRLCAEGDTDLAAVDASLRPCRLPGELLARLA